MYDRWYGIKKKPFSLMTDPNWSRSASRRIPSAPSMSGLPPMAGRPNFNQASAPNVNPTNKGFFGHMSPEELKDFQEVLKEMRTDIKPEFVGGGNYGRTQEYAHQPFLFDEATAAEYQRRKKFNPYV